ncbi:MAG: InlB B-repeat-containing protein, partial [Puniceicoccales bacterium]
MNYRHALLCLPVLAMGTALKTVANQPPSTDIGAELPVNYPKISFTDAMEVISGFEIVVVSVDEAMGSVSPGGMFSPGEAITLTATPEAGFAFEGWTGDLLSRENPLKIRVNSDLNLTAIFVPVGEVTPNNPVVAKDPVNSLQPPTDTDFYGPDLWYRTFNGEIFLNDLDTGAQYTTSWPGGLRFTSRVIGSVDGEHALVHYRFNEGGGGFRIYSLPDMALVDDIPSPGIWYDDIDRAYGFSANGEHALLPLRDTGMSSDTTQYTLYDLETRQLGAGILLDTRYDRIVGYSYYQGNTFTGLYTVEVGGVDCFLIARSNEDYTVAVLELRDWENGEIVFAFTAEDGRFHDGIIDPHTGYLLYPSTVEPSMVALDLQSGEVVRRIAMVSKKSVPSQALAGIHISKNGDILTWYEYGQPKASIGLIPAGQSHDTVYVNNPFAPGDIAGLTFLDANENGVFDIEIIEGDTPSIVYCIDVSGSTESAFEGAPVGDINNDGIPNTILDAEIASLVTFHQILALSDLGQSAQVAVVVFGNRGVTLDLLPGSGSATFVPPAQDLNGNGVSDVIDALVEITSGAEGAGEGTNFQTALQEVLATFNDAGGAEMPVAGDHCVEIAVFLKRLEAAGLISLDVFGKHPARTHLRQIVDRGGGQPLADILVQAVEQIGENPPRRVRLPRKAKDLLRIARHQPSPFMASPQRSCPLPPRDDLNAASAIRAVFIRADFMLALSVSGGNHRGTGRHTN